MKEIEAFTLPVTREQFCTEVQNIVADKNVQFMDAIIIACENHQIEIEDVAQLVDAKVKMELESEFRNANYLPKIGQLPL
jgi:type III secretion system FlhB-like substrate exporter